MSLLISASFDCLAEYTAATNRIEIVEHETKNYCQKHNLRLNNKSAVKIIDRKETVTGVKLRQECFIDSQGR